MTHDLINGVRIGVFCRNNFTTGKISEPIYGRFLEMMIDCFATGIICVIIGTLALLSSLTQAGRDLDRAYLKMLPKWMHGPRREAFRNQMGVVVGAGFLIGGISVLGYAVYSWWTGRVCG
jgi:hypothetical protein